MMMKKQNGWYLDFSAAFGVGILEPHWWSFEVLWIVCEKYNTYHPVVGFQVMVRDMKLFVLGSILFI